ncbi:MAG: APC family permease, partial [Blastocatellia bacterium]
MTIDRRFIAGSNATCQSSRGATIDHCVMIHPGISHSLSQSSLRDWEFTRTPPGDESPGYDQSSLRDWDNRRSASVPGIVARSLYRRGVFTYHPPAFNSTTQGKKMDQATANGSTGLVRGIRRWDLVAVAINGIIGAGIFGLPSKVFALIGPYSLIAFVACGLVVSLIVLCFAEVSSRFSDTGGPYLYARAAFGSAVG